jgi:uncharacterized protein YyaL (SSP411 family)
MRRLGSLSPYGRTVVRVLCLCSAVACRSGSVAEHAPRRSETAVGGAATGTTSSGFEPLPGAPELPPQIVEKLRLRRLQLAAEVPRTRHLRADGSAKYANRLLLETSPYLRQHAHNPVNWFPWGEEAFTLAHQLSRPILLSIGYSTCHWCHVMEEESFEDEDIAATINRSYIPIKVDREERPDIDAIYMSAVEALTGNGGWPMTVWLTPDRQPFFAGTYFPARDGDRGAQTGLQTLLVQLSAHYAAKPAEVFASAARLAAKVRASLEGTAVGNADPSGLPGAQVLHDAAAFYAEHFDEEDGGYAGAPKFPSSLPIRFLLRYYRRTGDARVLHRVTLTLDKMAAGGLYDHVGGGFHRYSTDRRWLVPHFEKMLYDNALLALDYLEAWQVEHDPKRAQTVREILGYVQREMTAPEGGFYSATDADSRTPSGRREEGWFFTWTPAEIRQVLPEPDAEPVLRYFAVTERGNFEGRNILSAPRSLDSIASELGLTSPRLAELLGTARGRLYAARSLRPAPLRDEKILTSSNALMISAFARAALVLGEPVYLQAAERAARFILDGRGQGARLHRSYMETRWQAAAYLDDYAFFIQSLLDLYESSHELEWLERALELNEILDASYADREHGAYFLTSQDQEALLAREKPAYDGAEPSGNSVQALNLLRLNELTTEPRYEREARAALQAFAPVLRSTPRALSELLLALDFQLDAPKEVMIVAPRELAEAQPLLTRYRQHFLPNHVLGVVSAGEMQMQQSARVPLLAGKVARHAATAYVCERRVCQLPTTDPDVFERQLSSVQRLPATAH